MRNLKDRLGEPFPDGWIPTPGEKVIVPSLHVVKRRAYSAVVEVVLIDIVRVRVPLFRFGRQSFLLRDIRPMETVKRD